MLRESEHALITREWHENHEEKTDIFIEWFQNSYVEHRPFILQYSRQTSKPQRGAFLSGSLSDYIPGVAYVNEAECPVSLLNVLGAAQHLSARGAQYGGYPCQKYTNQTLAGRHMLFWVVNRHFLRAVY